MKTEMSATSSPCCVPQTEAMPNSAENTPPSRKIPTQPSGEVAKSRRKRMRLMVAKAGAGPVDSRIGVKDSDTSTEGMTNRIQPPGSPTFISICAMTMPSICIII